jgi:putative FmdB family regulatory protein
MPLYEYKCKKCGHRFERIQSYSAPDVTECPVCQGEAERLISAPSIQFKGSGFYSTDYAAKPASSKSQESRSGSGSDNSSGDKGTTAKTESSSTSAAPAAPASGGKSE